ncbi:MAG: alpha/beta fold hydrolase [Actinomycetota bacterium]|nr:alpha/beta fold hydrolase [Actinomycetota bacterium]
MTASAIGEEVLTDVGGGVTLCHQSFGDPADPPMLMIMGLGVQMIAWPDDFCLELADRGFHVVRFDNRDIGRSTHIPARPPGLRHLALRRAVRGSYSLADMAADARRLIDALELAPAHVVGASMGGMIAQLLAIHHPGAVRSLTSIMSTTGGRFVGQPSPGIIRQLLRRPPAGREQIAAHAERLFRVIGSPDPHFDGPAIREQALRSFDRGFNPAGSARHMGAVAAARSRARLLAQVKAPTTVIHGKLDRLVPISGGRATAKAIPGARLVEIDDMGHDLPRAMWPQILDAIEANAARAS